MVTVSLPVGCLFVSGRAEAQYDSGAASWAHSAYMLGDWGGERSNLANQGIVFNVISVNDVLLDTRSDVANWSRVRGAGWCAAMKEKGLRPKDPAAIGITGKRESVVLWD